MDLSETRHISPEMFDRMVEQKFTLAKADKTQAAHIYMLTRQSRSYPSVLFDVLELAAKSGATKDKLAEIAFTVGMHVGYELGVAYPPLKV
jgi:hypothetical protein